MAVGELVERADRLRQVVAERGEVLREAERHALGVAAAGARVARETDRLDGVGELRLELAEVVREGLDLADLVGEVSVEHAAEALATDVEPLDRLARVTVVEGLAPGRRRPG